MLYLIYQIKKGVIDMTKKELKAVENILTESRKSVELQSFTNHLLMMVVLKAFVTVTEL